MKGEFTEIVEIAPDGEGGYWEKEGYEGLLNDSRS